MGDLDTLAHEVFAAVDAHDIDVVRAKLAGDCDFAAPGFSARGSEAVLAFMTPFLDAFPDIRHRLQATVEAGDTVAIELEITGTHTEPLAGPGGAMPPTGQRIRLPAANVWTVVDGQISTYHVYFDTATLMGQLGVAPT